MLCHSVRSWNLPFLSLHRSLLARLNLPIRNTACCVFTFKSCPTERWREDRKDDRSKIGCSNLLHELLHTHEGWVVTIGDYFPEGGRVKVCHQRWSFAK